MAYLADVPQVHPEDAGDALLYGAHAMQTTASNKWPSVFVTMKRCVACCPARGSAWWPSRQAPRPAPLVACSRCRPTRLPRRSCAGRAASRTTARLRTAMQDRHRPARVFRAVVVERQQLVTRAASSPATTPTEACQAPPSALSSTSPAAARRGTSARVRTSAARAEPRTERSAAPSPQAQERRRRQRGRQRAADIAAAACLCWQARRVSWT